MNLIERMQSGFTFFDGGCGTILQAAGLQPGELPEKWNKTHADVIRQMHYDYLLAGVHILKTNTFGANSLKYALDAADGFSLNEVVAAAVENARAAIRAAPWDPRYSARSPRAARTAAMTI